MKYFSSNMKYLRERNNLKQAEIQDRLAIERTSWSNYERGKSFPNLELFHKISKYFDISESDLLNTDLQNVEERKKTDVKKIEENVEERVEVRVEENVVYRQLEPKPILVREPTYLATPQGLNITQIPITDISVAAGTGIFNNDYIENMDFFGFPNHLLKPDRTYLSVRIKGASMAPTLQDGGYMAIRLVEKGEWGRLRDERIYVVSDIDGKSYLKRVKNRFKQGFIVLMSDSPDKATYPSFNLQADEIISIWEAEFYISAKMPNIHAQYYSRLQV